MGLLTAPPVAASGAVIADLVINIIKEAKMKNKILLHFIIVILLCLLLKGSEATIGM